MSANWIITIYVVIDDLLQSLEYQIESRRRVSDSKILTNPSSLINEVIFGELLFAR